MHLPHRLRPHILTAIEHGPYETALGYLRYEAMRKLSPWQWAEIHKRNLAGENFDEMIDVEMAVMFSPLRRVRV